MVCEIAREAGVPPWSRQLTSKAGSDSLPGGRVSAPARWSRPVVECLRGPTAFRAGVPELADPAPQKCGVQRVHAAQEPHGAVSLQCSP